MSTITVSPAVNFHAPRRAQAAPVPALQLTRRGRVVLLTMFLAIVAALMITLGGFATATLDSGTPEQVRTVTVAPGDTLFGIAGEIAEPGQIRETVSHIKKLNSMSGSSLQAGDKIAVPLR